MFRFFKKNREALKKYLLIFFLSVVSIGMVVTLAPISGGDTSQMQGNVIASVAGAQITTQDLQVNIQSQLKSAPTGLDPNFAANVANNMLDEMIIQRAMTNQAHKLGIEVTERELVQALQRIPSLFNNGQFVGMAAYQNQIMGQTGMTVPQFETQLKERMLFDKLRSIVVDEVGSTPAEAHEEFLRRNTKAKIAYVLFDPSQLQSSVEIKPGDLDAFFKKVAAGYKAPEKRRVRYVLIDPDRVRAEVKLDDATLRQYYTQHLSDYRVPERVKVAHILFKTTGKNASDLALIENTARQVLAQIKSGADFGELAKKYSADTATASKGGELGWIVRKQTVPEFEATAFSLKPGQVSELVKTQYGFHIIKGEEKQEAHLQTFDEMKEQIRRTVEQQQFAAAEQSLAQQFISELKANPKEDFETAARKVGLEAKETPPFKYGDLIPDFGNSESFSSLAFQLRQGDPGQPLSIPKGLAVIQLAELVPEHIPTLDEVRVRAEADYRQEQAKVLAAGKAKDFAAQAKTGDFAKVAKAAGVEVKESKDFTRQDTVSENIPGSELTAAFALDPGQTSDPIAVGDVRVVFRVLSHIPASEADFAAQQPQIAEELLQQKRAAAFEIYQDNLKKEMTRTGELKVNDAALKQFLAQYQGGRG